VVERATLTRAYPNRLAVHLRNEPRRLCHLGGQISWLTATASLEKLSASFNFPWSRA
jgi:hypothetical protein